MVKRKATVEHSWSSAKRRKGSSLNDVINQGVMDLARALKLARGFERQKLGRRLKTAQASADITASERINAEIEVLKNLDFPATSQHHLARTIFRTKSLANAVPEGTSRQLEAWRGKLAKAPTVLNVTARLFNVKAVKDALESVLESLRTGLDLGGSQANTEERTLNPSRLRKDGDEANDDEDQADGLGAGVPKKRPKDQTYRLELLRDLNVDNSPANTGKEPGGTEEGHSEEFITDTETSELDHNAVTGSDFSDSPSDSLPDSQPLRTGDVDENFSEGDDDAILEELASRLGSHSSSPSASGRSSPAHSAKDLSKSPPPSVVSSNDSRSPSPTRASKTTFLPSLSQNYGYIAASDMSSASDLSDQEAAPRKNRRGQRARQKIWELKYKQKAKHLLKEQKEGGRDQGWDAKRGAVDNRGDKTRGNHGRYGTGKGRGGQRGSRSGGRGPLKSGANEIVVVPRSSGGGERSKGERKRDDLGALHPSWEAAKKAKERKTASAFQGKKVVFD